MECGSRTEKGTNSSVFHRLHFGGGVSANFHHFTVTTLPTEISYVSIGFRGSSVASLVGSETLLIVLGLPTQESATPLRGPFSPHVTAQTRLLRSYTLSR